ncbi:type I 3-dehydroquinate dehydratase [Demequina sp. B12]|uniref:type I 3-dehydroquinate dehydratase n=1 Tax=Demequina sp. B12 TaxID=2992757 RepID=UPI00237C2389|nr:type I 3-dehydroquinate dehydratase [Demequina sp. B12]MDE0571834.1 type I 3-dehydroquinate dehydratase [Demequina sp. B12]
MTLAWSAESPAVIVPVLGASAGEVAEHCALVVAARPDVIEWRIDPLIAAGVPLEGCLAVAQDVAEAAGDIPVLVTLRTAAEGGLADVDNDYYQDVLVTVVEMMRPALIDVEMARATADAVVAAAHASGVDVVGSRHHFDGTPAREEIVATLEDMAERGADVPKIAVMPHTPADAVTLLDATERASRSIGGPVITMSMGELGVVSRVAGGVFGSVATFAMVGQASAPGQVEINALRAAMGTVLPGAHTSRP